MKKPLFKLGLAFAVLFSISACKKDDTTTPVETDDSYKYLLALSLPTVDSYPFHVLKDVESGTANISESQEIPDIPDNVPVNGKGGFLYLNSAEKLTKYEVGADGILKSLGSVPNTGMSGGPVSTFIGENRLLVSTGPRQAAVSNFNYQIINTENMSVASSGAITLPITEGSLAIPSLYIHRDGKIFVPYLHTNAAYESYNNAPVAIFNATTMAYEKTIYTDKAAGLGYSVVSSHGIAENGDLYIIACNSNYWAVNESIPSGIVRIKSGQTEFDDYFFNISEKVGGSHTGGMIYAGNNKAIVQVFRSDLIKSFRDYQNSFVIEYYVVDLSAKSVQKLNIPLTKYPRRTMGVLENGKIAIVGNTESEGNNIYIFDPATNQVRKGLSYVGTEEISTFLPFK